MRIVIGADHGGFALKRRLVRMLRRAGHHVRDVGNHSPAPCDYPRIAVKVARAVAAGRVARGVLLCKSGVGMAIAANKVPGVRAAVAPNLAVARTSREHNDANVVVLGAVGLPLSRARRILETWLATPFEGGRHARRVRQIAAIERAHSRRLRRADASPQPSGLRRR